MGYGGPGAGEYILEGDGIWGSRLHQRADQLPLSIHEDIDQIAFDRMPCPM